MDKLLKVVAEQNEEAESFFQLKRIADALEEVLRLVKQDQEDAKKRMLAAADEGLKEHEETHD